MTFAKPDLRLEDFPFRSEAVPTAGNKWFELACRQLLVSVGLPDYMVPVFEVRPDLHDPSVDKKVRVGFRLRSIRKKTQDTSFTAIQVSFAAFGVRNGAILRWSSDFDPDPNRRDGSVYGFAVRDGRPGVIWRELILDPSIIAALRKLLTGGTARPPAPPSATASLSHDQDVAQIVMTASGEHVASVGDDRRLRIWNTQTGAATANVKVTAKYSAALALAPAGGSVAVGATAVSLLSVPSGKRIKQLRGHPKADVTSISFSPSGTLLASAATSPRHTAGPENGVALWEIATGKELARWRLPHHSDFVVAFSRDGTRLFVMGTTPSDGGTVWAFDAAKRTRPMRERRHAELSWVARPALAASDEVIVAALANTVLVLNPETLELTRTLDLASGDASAPSPDCSRVAQVVEDGVLVVSLDGRRKRRLRVPSELQWNEESAGNSCVAWSPTGGQIAAAHGTRVVLWNAVTGACLS
jgi:DNA-binding beta-propeller fold protein YncE